MGFGVGCRVLLALGLQTKPALGVCLLYKSLSPDSDTGENFTRIKRIVGKYSSPVGNMVETILDMALAVSAERKRQPETGLIVAVKTGAHFFDVGFRINRAATHKNIRM